MLLTAPGVRKHILHQLALSLPTAFKDHAIILVNYPLDFLYQSGNCLWDTNICCLRLLELFYTASIPTRLFIHKIAW